MEKGDVSGEELNLSPKFHSLEIMKTKVFFLFLFSEISNSSDRHGNHVVLAIEG